MLLRKRKKWFFFTVLTLGVCCVIVFKRYNYFRSLCSGRISGDISSPCATSIGQQIATKHAKDAGLLVSSTFETKPLVNNSHNTSTIPVTTKTYYIESEALSTTPKPSVKENRSHEFHDIMNRITSSAPALTGFQWVTAPVAEIEGRQLRRGCISGHLARPIATSREGNRHASCCPSSTADKNWTDVKHLILHGPHHFKLDTFVEYLRGGVLTFIGDSVSAQAFWSILYRFEFSQQYIVKSCLVSTHELVTSSASIMTTSGDYCFSMELMRSDRIAEFRLMVKVGLRVAPVRQPQLGKTATKRVWKRLDPRHVVVVNIGLHYHDTSKYEMDSFKKDLQSLASRMKLFNVLSNHLSLFRDVTPQHYKPKNTLSLNSYGQYALWDKTSKRCMPIPRMAPGATSSAQFVLANKTVAVRPGANLHSRMNTLVYDTAREHGILVQRLASVLSSRYDAHIESRASTSKKFVLDCTHWCPQVMDAFDDTLVEVLWEAFGRP
eukprot:m.541799 g.541799  ORF g.541799 m.541799 type:complete len:494 (+) comp22111_c3_seq3:325-1806(+)